MSDSELSGEKENLNDVQLQFVQLLKEYPVLLNKSQTPAVKSSKSEAMQGFCAVYKQNYGRLIAADQVKKKINNMKTEVKKKSDKNSTGNKKIKLKEWEKLFLQLIDGDDNPSISHVPGGCSVGLNSNATKESSTESSAIIVHALENNIVCSPKKKSKPTLPETEETKHLTTSELQRLVLLEQLKLIRMQQENLKSRSNLLQELDLI